MTSRTTDYLKAINNLSDGSMLVFEDVRWDDYEELLDSLSESVRYRLAYDRGRLEVMSPQSEHESYAALVSNLVRIVCDELELDLEDYRTTTWKKKKVDGSVEADVCFYVANAYRVIGKRNIDLEYDPSPDIVVEIDITSRSSRKFPIYARLAVPEIWHYDGTSVRFYSLIDGSYVESPASRSLPPIQPAAIGAALEQSKTDGQTAALRTFRNQFRNR